MKRRPKPLAQLTRRSAFNRGVQHGIDLSRRGMRLREDMLDAALRDLFDVGARMALVCQLIGEGRSRVDEGDKQTLIALDRKWWLALQDYRRLTGRGSGA